MTAKEIQLKIIKEYLKPRLKSLGYLTNGQNWWKDKGDFFIIIQLQNFSWNNKNKVDFCFNIGITLKAVVKDLKKPYSEVMTVFSRENSYLPKNRIENEYHNNVGYSLTDEVNEDKFLNEITIDFEDYIFPYFDKINTLQDCIEKFGDVVFFGEFLKNTIKEKNLI